VTTRVALGGPAAGLRHRAAVIALLAADPQDAWGSERPAIYDRHRARAGFLFASAIRDGALVGFCYGYRLTEEDWWRTQLLWQLAPADQPVVAVGAFSVVELHVAAAARRRGLGRRLLRRVVDSAGAGRSPSRSAATTYRRSPSIDPRAGARSSRRGSRSPGRRSPTT
jgi:GNAT superfamily N-acetyltransferase